MKIWLSGDSAKIKLRNDQLLGKTMPNLKVGSQQILRENSA